jgi:hypothetical protein
MFSVFYDIIAKVIAAQRFPAWTLLALARKCHETCGCVTFCEILGGLHYPPAVSRPSLDHLVIEQAGLLPHRALSVTVPVIVLQ